MNTSEILNRAADLIEERGWTQGPTAWKGHAGSGLCLEGGLAAAAEIEFELSPFSAFQGCPAYHAVRDHLDMEKPWKWNDTPGRTASEVIEVLRAAAVIQEARENATVEVTA